MATVNAMSYNRLVHAGNRRRERLMIPEKLLRILVCPKCKGELEHRVSEGTGQGEERRETLICRKCRLMYEVKHGIPNMIVEEARPLEE